MLIVRRPFRLIALLALAPVLALFIGVAEADKVVLRIRTTNKDQRIRTREVRSDLPARVRTNDVINLDGMELKYDVQNDVYYVYAKVELQPKGVPGYQQEFRVEIRDIWVVPEEELSALKQRAIDLAEMLKGQEKNYELATTLRDQIHADLDRVLERQEANAILPEGMALGHITAYDANIAVLKHTKDDVRRIENLVLSSGQDPGELIGSSRVVDIKRQPLRQSTNYVEMIYKLVIRNPSPTETRVMTIHHSLPPEITPEDIRDPAGLVVRIDSSRNCCYLYKEDVQIPPGESVPFSVKIWDKWNVNKPRIVPLKDLAVLLYEKVKVKGGYVSVEKRLDILIEQLDAIDTEEGPVDLSPAYVAFYRGQAARLDRVEEAIYRIKEALTPVDKATKYGFKAKPPSMKSTWLIIYIILGFLAVVSLLFFFRWYGKTSSEIMEGDKGDGTS